MKKMATILLLCFFLCFSENTVFASADTVKTYSLARDGNIYLSPNFQVKEFACGDGSDEILIDSELIDILQNIRDHFNARVIITSGYRTPSYNSTLKNAVKNSYHTKGMAADIKVSGISSADVAKYAENIGVREIGKYNSYVHVGTRPTKYYYVNNGTNKVSTHGGNYNSIPYIKSTNTNSSNAPASTGNSPHTCSGGAFLWYWSAHPHYNCYACATCGKEWANKNETNYIASCSECNPPKQSAGTTVSKWVTCKTKIKIPAGSPKTWVYRVPESDTVSNKTWDYFSTRTEDINFTSQKYVVLSNGKTRYQVNVTANGETITAYINATDVQVVNTYHTTSSTNYDSSHPHKKYTVCECGQKTYTGETKKVDGCTECYPKVEKPKPKYFTITYNANGGSGAPSSETIPDYDGAYENIKISSKEPTRSGYVFLGWSTDSQASSADYEGGDRYNITKDITFYAVWEEEPEIDYSCGRNMTWEYDDWSCTLTISGSGYMYDYDDEFAPWYDFAEDVKIIEIEDGVKSIGAEAFDDFENLYEVIIPDSVIGIGKDAFENCDNFYVDYDGTESEFNDIDVESGNETIFDDVDFRYFTVTFMGYDDDNTIYEQQRVKKNGKVTRPKDPVNPDDGWVFTHWNLNGYYTQEGFDFDTKVTEDLLLVPSSTKVNNDDDKIILTIGEKEAKVFGKTKINDVAPVIRNGRTMLPARFVAEALGASVEWDEENQLVSILSKDIKIYLRVGESNCSIGHQYGPFCGTYYEEDAYEDYVYHNYILDQAPFIENSRTYLPVRFIVEQLGADVEWDADNQQVIITKGVS